MRHQKTHGIGIRFLSQKTIHRILVFAKQLKQKKVVLNMSNKTVAHVFFEPSTRTRLSFEMATHRCGATPMILDVKHSSLTKGESLIDMMRNIESLGVDAL
ncbi:MAG: aspartate carbamoyltransferase, partial [Candidatus Marinamargulisbacteria bacterium]